MTKAIVVLDYLQGLEGKTLLLKTTHTLDIELGGIWLELTWKPS